MILAYNETGWTSYSLLVQGSCQLETRFSCNCDHRHWQIILTITICKNTREYCFTGNCIFTKLSSFWLVSILPAKFISLDQVDSVVKTSKWYCYLTRCESEIYILTHHSNSSDATNHWVWSQVFTNKEADGGPASLQETSLVSLTTCFRCSDEDQTRDDSSDTCSHHDQSHHS